MKRANKPVQPTTSGVLVLDKPAGLSSMRAVAEVRGRAGGIRTGHAGTLDPLATGVLVLALGRATKAIDRIQATSKRYRTEIDLSAFTTTDDLEGERQEVEVAEPPDGGVIGAALKGFVGGTEQAPPAYSAVKVGGKRAYKIARSGGEVELPKRPVMVHSIEPLGYEWPVVELAIHCEKGFYVRSLARDLGRALGCGGHCRSIRRTAVGPFTEAMARRLEDLPDELGEEHLIGLDAALRMVAEAGDQEAE